MQNRKRVTEKIKARAYQLGFQLAGVTTPEPPPHMGVYRRWIAAGRHGTMAYLASERAARRRADPRQILPDCKSILALACNYAPQERGLGAEVGPGIAAYARGEDYHDVLLARMQSLVAYIEDRAGRPVSHRIYTDTGPVMERELAQRAGLGWIGKNTCLIHPKLGSMLFLAEILLGIELEVDPPFNYDHCGTCTLCMEACPTSCILEDRTLDARRCISYLTIEHRGPIPEELRDQVEGWVFGCDICQQVCPWNVRFAAPNRDPAFQARAFLSDPTLEDFLSLDPDRYQSALKGSPLKRAKRQGLVRNAAIAAGSLRDTRQIPALIQVIRGEPDPIAREHAAWALGRIGGEEARAALLDALQEERDAQMKGALGDALKALRQSRSE
jgi:epoxyqueuosine reductase